jgi:hypothetical protein
VTSRARVAILLVAGVCGCVRLEAQNKPATDKLFVAGGRIEMQLDGGNYNVLPAIGDHIRVTLSGNPGTARVDVTAAGPRATVAIRDTPHNNFQATIEVPKAADLVIRLSGGNLVVAAIVGSKDIENVAGNTDITVGDPNDYASVDASVNAGDIDANVFPGAKASDTLGLFHRVSWSGRGKYTLRASVGAGNLTLRK